MIRKAITYFAVITACLYGLRQLHYKGLLMQSSGYYAKFKSAFLEKNNFDVLFMGSSRAEMHYDPKIFDELTGMNSFNLGMAGATPHVSFAALKAYLHQSSAPKYLVYEIDFHFLKYKSTEVKEFNNYFPFLSNPVLRQEFSNIDPRMKHFYYNPYFSFPFTGLKNISTGLHGWFHLPNQTDSLYYKGYLRTDSVFQRLSVKMALRREKSPQPYYSFFNVTERAYLDSIIKLCSEKNIQLSLVSSPMFAGGERDLVNKQQIINQVKNIALINHLTYLDFSDLPLSGYRNLFIDHFHMLDKASAEYSRHFAEVFNLFLKVRKKK